MRSSAGRSFSAAAWVYKQMEKHIRTKQDAIARYKMRVAAARAKFLKTVEEVQEEHRAARLKELRKKLSA